MAYFVMNFYFWASKRQGPVNVLLIDSGTSGTLYRQFIVNHLKQGRGQCIVSQISHLCNGLWEGNITLMDHLVIDVLAHENKCTKNMGQRLLFVLIINCKRFRVFFSVSVNKIYLGPRKLS